MGRPGRLQPEKEILLKDSRPDDADVDAARAALDEEVKDACSVAAENLEEYRRLRGLTSAQVGEAIGISESAFRAKMRAVENMRLGEFIALCATLEVDPGVAFGFIDGEDAPGIRDMHRLGAVEDHRYIGEMAQFLLGKTGGYLPRHAVVPEALADFEAGFSEQGADEGGLWPRWYETDESYADYGPYAHAEWADDDEDGPDGSGMTGYFMDADGNIYDPDQEARDQSFAEEVAAYLEENGISVRQLGSGKLALGVKKPEDGEDVEGSSN